MDLVILNLYKKKELTCDNKKSSHYFNYIQRR